MALLTLYIPRSMKRLSIQSFKNGDFFLLCVYREQIFNNEISQFIYKDRWRQNVRLRSEIGSLLSFVNIYYVKGCAYLLIRRKTFKGYFSKISQDFCTESI